MATPATALPNPFDSSAQGQAVLGPVPAGKGQPVCLFFESRPVSSEWAIYNAAGEKVAVLSFGGEAGQCWQHAQAAPGIYFVSLRIRCENGEVKESVHKVAITP
jgi:hypothetical protein